MSIFQTDLHCTKKNEFAYFIEINDKLFCIGTTEQVSFWELSVPVAISSIDLVELTPKRFFTKKHYGRCKVALSREMIEAIL